MEILYDPRHAETVDVTCSKCSAVLRIGYHDVKVYTVRDLTFKLFPDGVKPNIHYISCPCCDTWHTIENEECVKLGVLS